MTDPRKQRPRLVRVDGRPPPVPRRKRKPTNVVGFYARRMPRAPGEATSDPTQKEE